MQEEEKKIEPMVDIDTSGPGADVELEEQKPEGEVETCLLYTSDAADE